MTDPYQPPPPPPDPQPYGYQPPPYYPPQPIYPYGYAPPRSTEGLAIASMVVSLVSIVGLCFYGLGGALGVVGAVLGHVARHKIARNGLAGSGPALAGIIVGWAVAALGALLLASLVLWAVKGTATQSLNFMS